MRPPGAQGWRVIRALLSGAVASTLASTPLACPCQGSAGPGAAITTSMERFGASVTETARIAQGTFRSNGEYAPLAPGVRQWSLDLGLLAGYRPVPEVEVSAETAIGHGAFTGPGFASERTGFGDTIVRARWDARDEPMPYERPAFPWPSLALVLSLRVPTAPSGNDGSGTSGTTGSIGSSSSSEGLGAFEPSLAAVLVRTLGESFQVNAALEGAYRFSDHYLGRERQLAPRVLAQLGARYMFGSSAGVGVLTDLGAEGDVAYDGGPAQPDTSQRLWTVGAFGYLRAEPTGLRVGAMFRYAPPLSGVSQNALAATSFGVTLGYSR